MVLPILSISTERFNLNVSTCLQDGAAGHFLCPAFSRSFDLHMPVSYCGTRVLEMKENVGKDLRVQEEGLSTSTSPQPCLSLQKAW